MNQDFHPLCNEHYSQMVEVSIIRHVSASEVEIPVRACTRQSCARHYDTNVGYYDLTTQGRLQGKYDRPYTCSEHHVKLYVKSYNCQSNTEVWQCPTEGCTCTETVRIGR